MCVQYVRNYTDKKAANMPNLISLKKNFQIIVEDSPKIQASLTYNQYSKDGRNILRVSKGLIANVQNEAQLAFVLAHELGHFQVYETRNKDKNGINVSGHEHEMQADYLGFQSILQAGYNPDEAIKFFEMIQETPTDVRSAFESANNEHGSTATRIANIKDYKSAAEVSGIAFSDYTGEVSYHNFQQKFMFAAQNDHYIGYLEERIRKEYNVASSQELSPHERWNFCEKIITEEPAVLSTGQRMGEFAHIFNRDVTEIKEEDIAQINRIVQKTFDYEKNYMNLLVNII